ncbi:MAG TPA: phosphoenolpyruvate--protein phosphotransferase [Candidatus Udaeobacter sp.]|nr:phosphoenolpyruvate--protein phosphotransferase [Candidatus Udaeobacter sp.]
MRSDPLTDTRPSVTLSGIAVAPGIAIGPVHFVPTGDIVVPDTDLEPNQVEVEIERFSRALDRAREHVSFLRARVAEEAGEEAARILDAQLLFLEDDLVVSPVRSGIRSERKPAAAIFRRHVGQLMQKLEAADDRDRSERLDLFSDIQQRVLRLLIESADDGLGVPISGVLVGTEVAPSQAALLDRGGIQGFAVEQGGMTSHSAIMARAKGVAAVVGVKSLLRHARPGDQAVVDGLAGTVVLNPPPAVLKGYERRRDEYRAFEGSLSELRDQPAVTTDGRRIELGANLESPAELARVLERGADSIGLYRTEFFYLERARMPDEEEQYQAYREVAERMAPRPVIIRTMDLGGDKVASYLGADIHARETNPFLGWRGIRFSLEHRDAFRTQLRAIYRAARHGQVKVMLPMVTCVEELRASRALAAEVEAELAGKEPAPKVEFGIMVETPAAVFMADVLAREVDFFSVGSNDLIQYMMAADRSNPKTASLYQPLHPAILRALRIVVDAARAEKIWVGVCGEMAADPLAVTILVGLGFDEMSVSPYLVPEVKTVVRSISYVQAQAVAEASLRLDSAAAVRAMVRSRMSNLLPKFMLP